MDLVPSLVPSMLTYDHIQGSIILCQRFNNYCMYQSAKRIMGNPVIISTYFSPSCPRAQKSLSNSLAHLCLIHPVLPPRSPKPCLPPIICPSYLSLNTPFFSSRLDFRAGQTWETNFDIESTVLGSFLKRTD